MPAQIHGNTRLEVGWTVARRGDPASALAVVTFAKLSSIQDPPNSGPERRSARRRRSGAAVRERRAQAAAERQIAEHPGDRPPVHLAVRLPRRQRTRRPGRALLLRGDGRPDRTRPSRSTSSPQDVVHSWWIPELGGKFQAVPGYHNYTWFKISKPGVYRGQCAVLCGRGHARMIATREGRPAGAVRSLAGLPEAADRRSQRRSARSRAPS